MKNSKTMWIFLGIILAIYSSIVWIVPWEKNGCLVLSYIFTVVAFLFQGVVWKISWDNSETAMSKFYGIPIFRVGIIYLVVQICLSFVVVLLSKVIPYWIPILLYIIVLGAFLIGLIAATQIKEQIDRMETEQKKDTKLIKKMRVESDYLYQRYSSQEKLKLIADKIKYSDPVSMDELEDEEKELALLLTQMEQLLQNNEVERFESMADEFLTKLERRNNLCKMYK